MNVKLSSAASDDILDGFQFYEDDAETIGVYFVETVFAELARLEVSAGIHPIKGKHFVRLIDRFPFAIFYRVVDDMVLVDAILDTRRNPRTIKKRLRG